MFNDHFHLTSNEQAQFFTFLLQINSRQTSLEPNRSLRRAARQVYKSICLENSPISATEFLYILSKTDMNKGVRMFPDVPPDVTSTHRHSAQCVTETHERRTLQNYRADF